MRDHKFKAYHKEENKIFKVFGFDMNHVYLYTDSNIPIPPTREDVVLMEWTGMLDSENVEIYEDDIIEYTIVSSPLKYKKRGRVALENGVYVVLGDVNIPLKELSAKVVSNYNIKYTNK